MDGNLHWLQRLIVGAAGGMLSVGSKFLAQDFDFFKKILDAGEKNKISNLFIGYSLMGGILILLGMCIAWIADDEKNKIRLLAISISAPALITTWAGGSTLTQNHPSSKAFLEIIGKAYAQAADEEVQGPSVYDGVKLFFGYGRQTQLYRIVVASYLDATRAMVEFR